MNRKNWPTVVAGGIVVVALAAAFVLTQGGAGQVPASETSAVLSQSKDAAPAVQPAMASAPAAPRSGEAAPPGPGVEGIKVHGHWTIDVLELNGQLVSHTEFDNALTSAGGLVLARFLAREKTPGWWRIYSWAGGASSNQPCSNLGTPAACMIGESAETATTPNLFKTLTVSVTASNNMRLSGTATAQRNGEIGRVETFVYNCSNTIAPNVGCGVLLSDVTSKELVTPVPVLLNQQVVITVEIGFN